MAVFSLTRVSYNKSYFIMKVKNILAGVCGLAALFCSCTKNEPVQKPVAVEEVKLDAAVRVPRGGEKQLVAVVLPEGATYDAVVWSSDDETVATVDENGLVKAVGRGETKIKAAVGEKSAECTVTVYVAVTGISLDKTELELSVEGTSVKLAVDFEPFGVDESEKVVTWTSSKPDVATVAEDGTVSPVAEGEATVTAKCADFTAECKVTVIKPAKVWTVGEYYEVDGVKGVVCWVSDDSQHGKIVSLDEKSYGAWSTRYDTTGATSEDSGKENTLKIKDMFPDFAGYASFKWCVDKGEGWYFPAVNEMYQLLKSIDAVNAGLTAHGGKLLTKSDYYWSSTDCGSESEGTEALQVYYSGEKVTSYGEDKNYEDVWCIVRAMYEF